MTDELFLYKFDRAAWVAYAAPRWVQLLKAADADRKRELWAMAGDDLKREIRRLADATPAA